MKYPVRSMVVLLAALAAADPTAALADGWHRHGWHRGGDVVVYGGYPYYSYPAYGYAYPAYGYAPVYQAPPRPVYSEYPATSQSVICTNRYNPFGALVGGIAGGALGSTVGRGNGNVAATIGGVLAGGAIGASAGLEQDCTTQFVQQQQIGVPMVWQDPSGPQYAVTPVRSYSNNGRYCREYQAEVMVGGRPRESYGTACRQPDGSWQIMD